MKKHWTDFKKWLIKKLGGSCTPYKIIEPVIVSTTKRPIVVQAVQAIDAVMWEESDSYQQMTKYRIRDLLADELGKIPGAIKTEVTYDQITNRYLMKESVYIIPFEEVEK